MKDMLAAWFTRRAWSAWFEWLAMALVVALSALLEFWRLEGGGYGNEYYSAAVWSMAHSWRAFWFAGFDSNGFISVDKPPLGFWIQVASVKLLGYSPFSLLAPEALAGVLAVIVLWRVTRRVFGPAAGALAALALAVTPISVVANRDNILEPTLVLTLLLAAWALLAALERGSWGWLALCALLVGLGFNIKMLEAYLVLPAFALVYVLRAPIRRWARLAGLALAGAALAAVSFAWIGAVDLIPAGRRPYVGSTTNNSEFALAFGYNGALRLFGRFGGPPHAAHIKRITRPALHPAIRPAIEAVRRIGVGAHPPRLPERVNPMGASGALRLFQPALGSQVSWLLPLALAGLVMLWLWRPAQDADGAAEWRLRGALLWGAWLLVCALTFSFGQTLNVYYVAVLAPAVCALAAVGGVRLWRAYRAPGWWGYALPLVIAVTGAQQGYLTQAAPGWGPPWQEQALAWGGLALALVAARVVAGLASSHSGDHTGRVYPVARWDARPAQGIGALALALLLALPLLWSSASLTLGNGGGWPVAGPQYATTKQFDPRRPLVDPRLVAYLERNREGAPYLAATVNAYLASPLIIATGQPVMMLGGFSGNDPALNTTELSRLVDTDTVRYFILSSANLTNAQRARLVPAHAGPAARQLVPPPPTSGATYTNALTRWISQRCQAVPPAQWSSTARATGHMGPWEVFVCS